MTTSRLSEHRRPVRDLYWLSFASVEPPHDFLGVAIVYADDFRDAVEQAFALGINPGGEVRGYEVQSSAIPGDCLNRLIDSEEIARRGLGESRWL